MLKVQRNTILNVQSTPVGNTSTTCAINRGIYTLLKSAFKCYIQSGPKVGIKYTVITVYLLLSHPV